MSALAAAVCTAAIVAAGGSSTVPVVAPRIDVQTDCGAVRGQEDDLLGASFLGIPYAGRAVGTNRFRRSTLLSQGPAGSCWTGVFDAAIQGPECPQNPKLDDYGEVSWDGEEDCLTLDVWSPKPPNTTTATDGGLGPALLPVLVHIHGGSLETGTDARFEALAGQKLVIVGVECKHTHTNRTNLSNTVASTTLL